MTQGANPRYANGARRRRLRARLLAPGARCWICGMPIDPAEPHMSPAQGVVDELTPVKYGGSPTAPGNCAAAHRCCNGWRGTKPVGLVRVVQARVALMGGASSPVEWCAIARRALTDLRAGRCDAKRPKVTTDW